MPQLNDVKGVLLRCIMKRINMDSELATKKKKNTSHGRMQIVRTCKIKYFLWKNCSLLQFLYILFPPESKNKAIPDELWSQSINYLVHPQFDEADLDHQKS